MLGDFGEARRLAAEAKRRATELGQTLVAAASAMHEAAIELLAGSPEGAAEVALSGARTLEEAGENGWRSTVVCFAGDALYRLGRDDEAWRQTEIAEGIAAADDVLTHLMLRDVRAKILARRGDLDEAERLSREALALANTTDSLSFIADMHVTLAEVLAAAGRLDEAAAEVDRAGEIYARKGHLVGVGQARAARAALDAKLT
jgi:tetratricopeptide (TPR) repeat protein